MNYLDEIAAEIAAELPEELIPDENGVDELLRLYAVLVRAKGSETSRADVHDAWVAWMIEREPTHDALKPFSELDASTQREDDPFVDAIRRVARRRASDRT